MSYEQLQNVIMVHGVIHESCQNYPASLAC